MMAMALVHCVRNDSNNLGRDLGLGEIDLRQFRFRVAIWDWVKSVRGEIVWVDGFLAGGF